MVLWQSFVIRLFLKKKQRNSVIKFDGIFEMVVMLKD
jgi:hypothetical protein